MFASTVVLSTFVPSAAFSSTPNSSMKAPLVPEPSSRELTLISLLVSKSPVAASVCAASVAASVAAPLAAVVSLDDEHPHHARLPTTIASVNAVQINFFISYFSFFEIFLFNSLTSRVAIKDKTSM